MATQNASNANVIALEDESPDAGTSAVETIDEPSVSSAIVLTSGRSVEVGVESGGDLLRVRARGGEVVLSVLLTDQGPVLRFAAADLDIQASGRVSIACETFKVQAKTDVHIEAGGGITERAAGDVVRVAGGRTRQEARNIDLIAEPGTISVVANDDVDIKGERVRLNCEPAPMAKTWEEFIARVSSDG